MYYIDKVVAREIPEPFFYVRLHLIRITSVSLTKGRIRIYSVSDMREVSKDLE